MVEPLLYRRFCNGWWQQEAKKLDRKSSHKLEKERVLILCEDKVSVPAYLRKLIWELKLSSKNIVICDIGADPSNLVKQGKEKLEEDSDFEFVYFVFDRDTHEHYKSAISDIKEMNNNNAETEINIITSWSCFEFWLMLHLAYSDKPYQENKSPKMKSPCKNLIYTLKKLDDADRKKIFKNYEKSDISEYYDKIKEYRKTAIKNTKKIIANSQDPEYYENPHTRMHILVEKLENLSKKEN